MDDYYCMKDGHKLAFLADWGEDGDETTFFQCPECDEIYPTDLANRPIKMEWS